MYSEYHLHSGKNGEPSNQENIFCGIYRCWLQPMVMKLHKNYTIYYVCKECGGVYVKFWTFVGGGVYQNRTIANKRGEGIDFGHFVIT